MAVEFMGLPVQLFLTVCTFLDDDSHLLMREVSHTGKAIVDRSILNIRKTEVPQLYCTYDENKDEVNLEFTLQTSRDFILWKIFLDDALKTLEFDGINLMESYEELDLSMKLSEVARFIRYLTPLIRKAELGCLTLHAQMEMLREISVLVEHAPFDCAFIKDFTPQDTASAKYILKLADWVSKITIYMGHIVDNHAGIVSYMCKLMTRKCENVYLRNVSISLSHVDQLIQVFNQMEKKLSFKAEIDEQPMNANIGNFKVEIDGMRRISIEHLEYHQK